MQRVSHVITLQRWPVMGLAAWLVVVPTVSGDVLRPFPQAANLIGYGLKPNNQTQNQLNAAITNYYASWESNDLAASTKVVGDYKVNYDGPGATVSKAMGYGMLLTVYLAGADPNARSYFDGLNRFRKRYPSNHNSGLMCWKIPASENAVSDDCATDGDLDMAMALLLARWQWGDAAYLVEGHDERFRIPHPVTPGFRSAAAPPVDSGRIFHRL